MAIPSLQSIFDAITPENIKNIPVVKIGMQIFIDELEKNSEIAKRIRSLYDNEYLPDDSEKVLKAKEKLKQGMYYYYISNLYNCLKNLTSSKSIKQALKKFGYDNSRLFNNAEDNISTEFISSYRNYTQRVGTENAIHYIYGFAKYLETGKVEHDLDILTGENPFVMHYEGSLNHKIFMNIVKPLSHPIGWCYTYTTLFTVMLRDYFGIEVKYIFTKIEIVNEAEGKYIVFTEKSIEEAKDEFRNRVNPKTNMLFTDEEIEKNVQIFVKRAIDYQFWDEGNYTSRLITFDDDTVLYLNGRTNVIYYTTYEDYVLDLPNPTSVFNADWHLITEMKSDVKFLYYDTINEFGKSMDISRIRDKDHQIGDSEYFADYRKNGLNVTGDEYLFVPGYDESINKATKYDLSEYEHNTRIFYSQDYKGLFIIVDDFGNFISVECKEDLKRKKLYKYHDNEILKIDSYKVKIKDVIDAFKLYPITYVYNDGSTETINYFRNDIININLKSGNTENATVSEFFDAIEGTEDNQVYSGKIDDYEYGNNIITIDFINRVIAITNNINEYKDNRTSSLPITIIDKDKFNNNYPKTDSIIIKHGIVNIDVTIDKLIKAFTDDLLNKLRNSEMLYVDINTYPLRGKNYSIYFIDFLLQNFYFRASGLNYVQPIKLYVPDNINYTVTNRYGIRIRGYTPFENTFVEFKDEYLISYKQEVNKGFFEVIFDTTNCKKGHYRVDAYNIVDKKKQNECFIERNNLNIFDTTPATISIIDYQNINDKTTVAVPTFGTDRMVGINSTIDKQKIGLYVDGSYSKPNEWLPECIKDLPFEEKDEQLEDWTSDNIIDIKASLLLDKIIKGNIVEGEDYDTSNYNHILDQETFIHKGYKKLPIGTSDFIVADSTRYVTDSFDADILGCDYYLYTNEDYEPHYIVTVDGHYLVTNEHDDLSIPALYAIKHDNIIDIDCEEENLFLRVDKATCSYLELYHCDNDMKNLKLIDSISFDNNYVPKVYNISSGYLTWKVKDGKAYISIDLNSSFNLQCRNVVLS